MGKIITLFDPFGGRLYQIYEMDKLQCGGNQLKTNQA